MGEKKRALEKSREENGGFCPPLLCGRGRTARGGGEAREGGRISKREGLPCWRPGEETLVTGWGGWWWKKLTASEEWPRS